MSEQNQTESGVKENRFSAASIWRAHLKGLRNRNFRKAEPGLGIVDVLARGVLYGLPLGLAVAGYFVGAKVVAVDGLLAAAGILAGALFMAFTQVASWRERYTERQRERYASELPQRYSLDETVAHVLIATYASLALVVVVLVSANYANKAGDLVGVGAALTIALGSYVVLLLLIILPKLYAAYAVTHEVAPEMSGLSR